MTINNKVRILLISCILMVALLCWIQYRLVKNTYDLNTKAYLAEVAEKLNTLSQPFVDSANHRAVKELVQHVTWYLQHKNKDVFFDSLSQTIVRANRQDQQRVKKLLDSAFVNPPVKFSMQYSTITLAIDGVEDTVLKNTQAPLTILGEEHADHAFTIGEGFQTNHFTGQDVGSEAPHMFRLTLGYSRKADISGWQKQVVRSMAATFLIAVTIILGAIALFFFMFRALLQQKKMADRHADLTNNITHELQTPLTSLGIIIKSLRNPMVYERPAMLEELISTLERQQQKLSRTVERVSESAWITTAPLRMNQYEANSLVKQLVADFPMDAHILVLDIGHDKPVWMNTDEYILGNILYNILDNAAKYSPEESRIEVKTRVDENRFIISVTDHGKGIAASEQSMIFNKFYRVGERNLHHVKGMGLGLYLCQLYAGRLNGSLSVKSKLSKGSTFTLQLPIQ